MGLHQNGVVFLKRIICSGFVNEFRDVEIYLTTMLRFDAIRGNACRFLTTPLRGTAQPARMRHAEGPATLPGYIEEIFRRKPVLSTCAAGS